MALEAERHLPTYLQRDSVDRPGHLGREKHRQPDYATNPNGGLAAVAALRSRKVTALCLSHSGHPGARPEAGWTAGIR